MRARGAPRLVLYGPDRRHGATPRQNLRGYYYYIRHFRDGATKDTPTGVRFPEREEAERALADYIAGQVPGDGGIRLDYAFRVYIKSGLEPHSTRICTDAFRHIDPLLGHRLVGSLSELDFRRYHELRIKQGAAPSSIHTELSRLRNVINHCAKQNLCPAIRVWCPPRPETAGRLFTRDQIARLLRHRRVIRDTQSRRLVTLFILLSVYTCQRREAVMTLTWSPEPGCGYVSLQSGSIDFRRQRQAQNKKRRATQPIPRQVSYFLRAQRKQHSRYVFEGVANLKNSFNKLKAAAGLPDLRPHDLVHSGLTWRALSGTPLHVLSKFANKSPQTLAGIYLHAELSTLEAEANKRIRG